MGELGEGALGGLGSLLADKCQEDNPECESDHGEFAVMKDGPGVNKDESVARNATARKAHRANSPKPCSEGYVESYLKTHNKLTHGWNSGQ